MSARAFTETTSRDDRRQGRRVFRHDGESESLVVSIVSSIDTSPFADGSAFRPDPNGPSNREAAEALVSLAAQLLRQPVGNHLPQPAPTPA